MFGLYLYQLNVDKFEVVCCAFNVPVFPKKVKIESCLVGFITYLVKSAQLRPGAVNCANELIDHKRSGKTRICL